MLAVSPQPMEISPCSSCGVLLNSCSVRSASDTISEALRFSRMPSSVSTM